MVVLEIQLRNRPVNVGLCHCVPSKPKDTWDQNARAAVLPTVFDAVGAKLDGSSGVQEPTAWILDLSDLSNKYQAHNAAEGARI